MDPQNRPHDLVIVSCGGTKISPGHGELDHPVPAKDVFESDYFKSNRRYAEVFGKRWCLLGARHGFMSPDFPMRSLYNSTWSRRELRRMEKEGKTIDPSMIIEQLRLQAISGNPIKFESGWVVVVLGSKEYIEHVRYALQPIEGVAVLDPLKGLGIGLKKRAVKEAVRRSTPLC